LVSYLALRATVFRVNAHFDDSAQVLLNDLGRKILIVKGMAVGAPIGVEVDNERNLQLALQLQCARVTR
jgi:hypothetical protein